jgi:hypothetical protein
VFAILECRFWVWLNPKVIRLCYWAADLADKVRDYERRESLYKTAEALAESQRAFTALLRWYEKMH